MHKDSVALHVHPIAALHKDADTPLSISAGHVGALDELTKSAETDKNLARQTSSYMLCLSVRNMTHADTIVSILTLFFLHHLLPQRRRLSEQNAVVFF